MIVYKINQYSKDFIFVIIYKICILIYEKLKLKKYYIYIKMFSDSFVFYRFLVLKEIIKFFIKIYEKV